MSWSPHTPATNTLLSSLSCPVPAWPGLSHSRPLDMATPGLLLTVLLLATHQAAAQHSVKLGDLVHNLLFPSHELLGKKQLKTVLTEPIDFCQKCLTD